MTQWKPRDRKTIDNVSYIKESAIQGCIGGKKDKKGKSKNKEISGGNFLMTFSQKFTVAVFVLAAICLAADYMLTALGLEVNHTVTLTVLGILGVVETGYFGKSFAEKNSRNKYRVGEDGMPFAESSQYQYNNKEYIGNSVPFPSGQIPYNDEEEQNHE